MSSEPEFEFTPSLKIIYFGVGFTLAAAGTAVLLTVFRPMVMAGPGWLRGIAMLGPLIIGIPFGLRVLGKGSRDNLRLSAAIKRAMVP